MCRRSGYRAARLRRLRGLGLHGFAICLAVLGTSASRQDRLPGQFRAGIAAVPVEVRVLDRFGEPVTNLTYADFEIREAGVLQEVGLFRTVFPADVNADAGRTFLLVLGRGRLNEPTKAIDALLDFVRARAGTRDRVGVSAYLRVIEPTANHDAVVRFLTAFRQRHETIDGLLIRDGREPRQIARSGIRAVDHLFSRYAPEARPLPGAEGNVLVSHHTSTYVRHSLHYLRSVSGTKHAVVVSERPFAGGGPAPDDPLRNIWFRLATTARTTLSYVHAGGVMTSGAMSRGQLGIRSSSQSDRYGLVKDYALLTDQTGGISAFYKFAAEPLGWLDRITKQHYLLGYYPLKPLADHEFRVIEVSVTRPDVRLLYRHGFVAQPVEISNQDFRSAITTDRLAGAAARLIEPPSGGLSGGLPDGPRVTWLRVAVPSWRPSINGGTLDVSVSFDPQRVTFVRDGADYLTDLDLLFLADNNRREVIGERQTRLTIRFVTATEFARTRREWLRYDTTIDLPARPEFLRAAVFDYETDGSASMQVPVPREKLNLKTSAAVR